MLPQTHCLSPAVRNGRPASPDCISQFLAFGMGQLEVLVRDQSGEERKSRALLPLLLASVGVCPWLAPSATAAPGRWSLQVSSSPGLREHRSFFPLQKGGWSLLPADVSSLRASLCLTGSLTSVYTSVNSHFLVKFFQVEIYFLLDSYLIFPHLFLYVPTFSFYSYME